MGFFADERDAFELTRALWRDPQLGALGSLMAHWSLSQNEPALVCLPTGAGKTGVALAAPFVAPQPPERVLVLVPSKSVREQTVRAFSTMRLLREIKALTRWHVPERIRVAAVEGIATDWTALESCDVVVAIPQSISPASAASVSVPPQTMFDMVIVDEAHHLPSRTWQAVLEHIDCRYQLLLTATPFRLDKKVLPGPQYYFPLRQAIADGFYKPIRPMVLPRLASQDVAAKDATISVEIARLLQSSEHATSTLLVRAQTRARAEALATRYRALGVGIDVPYQPAHGRTSDSDHSPATKWGIESCFRRRHAWRRLRSPETATRGLSRQTQVDSGNDSTYRKARSRKRRISSGVRSRHG